MRPGLRWGRGARGPGRDRAGPPTRLGRAADIAGRPAAQNRSPRWSHGPRRAAPRRRRRPGWRTRLSPRSGSARHTAWYRTAARTRWRPATMRPARRDVHGRRAFVHRSWLYGGMEDDLTAGSPTTVNECASTVN